MEATTAAGIQDQFLNLLTTQLRHQDPLEPTKQEDFIAQLAQFSTLEGIEKLNDNFSDFMQSESQGAAQSLQFQQLTSAADLIGTQVTFSRIGNDGDSRDVPTTGVVDAVVLQGDAIHLRIDNELIRMDDLNEIGLRTS